MTQKSPTVIDGIDTDKERINLFGNDFVFTETPVLAVVVDGRGKRGNAHLFRSSDSESDTELRYTGVMGGVTFTEHDYLSEKFKGGIAEAVRKEGYSIVNTK